MQKVSIAWKEHKSKKWLNQYIQKSRWSLKLYSQKSIVDAHKNRNYNYLNMQMSLTWPFSNQRVGLDTLGKRVLANIRFYRLPKTLHVQNMCINFLQKSYSIVNNVKRSNVYVEKQCDFWCSHEYNYLLWQILNIWKMTSFFLRL